MRTALDVMSLATVMREPGHDSNFRVLQRMPSGLEGRGLMAPAAPALAAPLMACLL